MSHQAHFAQAIAEQRQAELVAAAAQYRLARAAARGRGTTPSAPVAAAPRGSWWAGSAASTPPPEPEAGVTPPFLLSRSASARTGHVKRHATQKEYSMTEGIKTIIIPVRDLAAAKALYGTALDVEPYADEPYYVGFRVGDQEIGLDPNGHNHGMTGPVGYCHVDDVAASLRQAVDAGWRTQQDVKDVGGGGLAAIVEDPDGNVVGFLQR